MHYSNGGRLCGVKQVFNLAGLVFAALVVSVAGAAAATYYVDGAVATDGGSGTSASPKKYIKSGIALMAGGDTLIIRDGVYTGLNNMMSGPGEWNGIPSGSAGAYTTIRAEHDFGVTLDGQNTYNPVYTTNNSYVQYQGLIIRNGTFYLFTPNNHIKVIKCAAFDSMSGNAVNFASSGGDYILFEDCFAWGVGRYKFLVGGGSRHTILRRCVGRYDWHDAEAPHAVFSFYGTENSDCVAQNCIAINSLAASGINTTGLYAPNGSTRVTYDSCIALDIAGAGSFYEAGAASPVLRNCVVWNTTNVGIQMYTPPTNASVTGCTIGTVASMGISAVNCTVTNTIISGTGGVAVNWASNDYCNLYNNSSNYANASGGSHNISVAPLSSGLRYLPRIEAGSTLKTAGASGGQIGAQIEYQLGVSGTLYGETGWNTLTGENLWPFPNEDVIRAQMRTYTAHSVNGARGFCADNTSLTRYIWEYLGNAMPADMYDMSVYPPSNLSASPLSSRAIALSWVANPLHESGFRIERKVGSDGTFGQIAEVGANALSYTNVGLAPNTTYFYRMRSFNTVNVSTYTGEVSAVTLSLADDTLLGKAPLVAAGEIRVVGSEKWKGVINPAAGETAKIYFKGSATGRFEIKIFTLIGELVWEQSMDNVNEGMFEWFPKNVASGGYIVFVKGPGLNVKKKIAILR